LPRYSRHALLKNSPNCTLAELFCTSRCMEETTSTGRFIAGLPVTGSVTLALFTSAPLCVLRAPFMLIWPSGPRTTPGIIGRALLKRSFTFGAARSVCSEIVSDGAGTFASVTFAVTVTVLFTSGGFSSRSVSVVFSASTVMVCSARSPETTASIRYVPGGTASKEYRPS